MTRDEYHQNLLRIRQIGVEIAVLMAESKDRRKLAATTVGHIDLPHPRKDDPTEVAYVADDKATVVTIAVSEDPSDYSVTFRDYPIVTQRGAGQVP